MHRLIAEEAGHTAVAELMSFVNHDDDSGLGRLDAEKRVAQLRASAAHPSSEMSAGRGSGNGGGLAHR